MKKTICKSCDNLPLFLNADTTAKSIGISPSSAHEADSTVRRIAVPKGKFAEWVAQHKRGRESG